MERMKKLTAIICGISFIMNAHILVGHESIFSIDKIASTATVDADGGLSAVLDSYLKVKNALIESDAKTSAKAAKSLAEAISKVDVSQLTVEQKEVWGRVSPNLEKSSKAISDSKEIEAQRESFLLLSKNMYNLIKVYKDDSPTYYQFCPMANDGKGANWLSKEKEVLNPYYGASMLKCGKVVETLE